MAKMNGSITLHNNQGTGFAKKIQIRAGATVGEVYGAEIGHEPDDKFIILLNGAQCTAEDTLKDGDRLVISPSKIKGAL